MLQGHGPQTWLQLPKRALVIVNLPHKFSTKCLPHFHAKRVGGPDFKTKQVSALMYYKKHGHRRLFLLTSLKAVQRAR